jgi:hypothetical protein
MQPKDYIKKFSFPSDFRAPVQFAFEDLSARPLTRSDLKADMEAVNSSIETIRKTRGGTWPEEEVSEEFDLLDLAWHERSFVTAALLRMLYTMRLSDTSVASISIQWSAYRTN